ncbi:hypothetical protein L218DRAFT_870110 [Marasmius fiardii PR-910]|nr:hypothetical protein L218DRAFT_870110 [Marasmius fiardii PR-910]
MPLSTVFLSLDIATTIEGLKTATPKVLFSNEMPDRYYCSSSLYLPEDLQAVGVVIAISGDSVVSMNRKEERSGTDPNDPSTGPYTFVNSLIPPNFDQWAVDGSILQLNNQLYLMFSGLKMPDPNWMQCLYMAKMSSPTYLSGDTVEISCPTEAWEKAAVPVLASSIWSISVHGYIVYSGSHCSTDDCALGMLALTPEAEPMVPKCKPSFYPKNTATGVYGPGHQYAPLYFAYHGKSEPNLGCGDLRTTRVQPFTIFGDTPVFPVAVGDGVPVMVFIVAFFVFSISKIT